ncbi:DNA-processing protein DprA [Proteus myxofaciens]|uniref:Rossmann fold nucleotide-binding protein n=1 Tax=Proteus myxofaciens ATCC 19692 TaxID=1354337 RepID=A0A198FTA2_9GAMM|nr:DNA-processing protein DprA [Proteus myxofaciens]OAT27346.1 Rossmann fold nucleotide-binding protein [Proteus myxofaciens ATCC 19692]
MDAREIWIRLNTVSRLPINNAIKIIEYLQLSTKLNHNQLKACGLSEQQSYQFMRLHADSVKSTLKWLDKNESALLTITDSDYPFLLKQISSPPLLLFVAGNREYLTNTQIALIGSRNATHYGTKWATYFAQELVKKGLTVTSGLAQGIDGIGHRSALKNGGVTIAVLGSGLENIYPSFHRSLATQIKESGVLISEHLPMAPPLAKHFPRRNRIISGLSTALLIIEAGIKSGSLITANYALQQGKELFVLPGLLADPHYEGNHQLIKQGANLASSPDDLIEYISSSLKWISIDKEINYESPKIENIQVENKVFNQEQELAIDKILPFLRFNEVIPIDIIANNSGLSTSQLAPLLLELELAEKIAIVAGGYTRLE